MRIIILALLVQSLWANFTYSLYTDKKGKRVGDVITVMILENAHAKNDTRTKTQKDNDVGLGGKAGSDLLSALPSWDFLMKTDIDYSGQGNTERQGEFKATISVKIMKVMDNGNLLIKGSKDVTLNSETETIKLSGLIRPEDISSSNTIYSFKIADAIIEYSGNGVLDDAQQPGLMARFFNWIF